MVPSGLIAAICEFTINNPGAIGAVAAYKHELAAFIVLQTGTLVPSVRSDQGAMKLIWPACAYSTGAGLPSTVMLAPAMSKDTCPSCNAKDVPVSGPICSPNIAMMVPGAMDVTRRDAAFTRHPATVWAGGNASGSNLTRPCHRLLGP